MSGQPGFIHNTLRRKLKIIFGFFAFSLLIASCHKDNLSLKHTTNTVSDAPVITSINPTLGNANTLVTITGKNFMLLAAGDTVKFNGVPAIIQSAADSVITVLAPTAGTNGVVTVATVKGKFTGPTFIYGPDVFAIGTMAMPGYVPLYWKNGVQISLDGSAYGFPTGLAVVDTTVYIAGYYYDTGGDPQSLFWKNLSLSRLSEGLVKHTTGGMAVSGNDVYIAGFLEPDNDQESLINIAEYWKNGQPVILSDTTQYDQATAIAVNGTDVYVAGNVSGIRYGWQGAAVWKNGVETILPQAPGGQYDYTTGIAIANGDVYISGYDNSTTTTAEYWKNGVQVSLSDNATASCIMVIGNDVYVGGSTWNGAHSIATYWKNGQATSLTDGTKDAAITAIAIDGSDVYAAGYRNNNNGPGYAPVYWKNGVETKLTRFEEATGYLTGIVVKAHKPY
ncbi:MAG: IPT/TIG domain-containing protein [Sphingobacteriales bacterium]